MIAYFNFRGGPTLGDEALALQAFPSNARALVFMLCEREANPAHLDQNVIPSTVSGTALSTLLPKPRASEPISSLVRKMPTRNSPQHHGPYSQSRMGVRSAPAVITRHRILRLRGQGRGRRGISAGMGGTPSSRTRWAKINIHVSEGDQSKLDLNLVGAYCWLLGCAAGNALLRVKEDTAQAIHQSTTSSTQPDEARMMEILSFSAPLTRASNMERPGLYSQL